MMSVWKRPHHRAILRTRRGVLLTEVLFAISAILMAGVWLLGAYSSAIHLASVAQQSTIALDDLKDIMEKIKSTAFTQLNVNFPNGTVNGTAPNLYSTVVGGYGLNNEQITVTHLPNAAADPKQLVVQLIWADGARQYTRTMQTFRSSRVN